MRRVLLMLATLAFVGVAVNQVQAHEYEYHHGHGYYAGYRAPIVVAPRVWPRVVEVAPEPFYPPVVYPPAVYPRPWRYCPGPSYGVYYRGPGLSIGVGF
jgi:hypothetical protein